jgi:beta-glucosidase
MSCANEALSTSDFNLNTTASTQTKSECRLEEAAMAQETRSAATQDSPVDVRAREVEQQMTDDERFSLLVSVCGENLVIPTPRDERIPEGTPMISGYTPGVPRLGIPALMMSDASMGVINPGFANRKGDTATALPASILLGSSFNAELARAGGQMIGRESRSRGFTVQLAGGINLARDPRNGRNFEYLGENPRC